MMNNQKEETKVITLKVSDVQLQEIVLSVNAGTKAIQCVQKEADKTRELIKTKVRVGKLLLEMLPPDNPIRIRKATELEELAVNFEKEFDEEIARLEVLEPLLKMVRAAAASNGVEIPQTGLDKLHERAVKLDATDGEKRTILEDDEDEDDFVMDLVSSLLGGSVPRGIKVTKTTITRGRGVRPESEGDDLAKATPDARKEAESRDEAIAERKEKKENEVSDEASLGRGL